MDSSLTIVLLGKTGGGKSASGNTILGREAFESRMSFKSVTTRRSEETEYVFGKQISVVDTPEILSAEEDVKTWCQEVLASSRPCLFLVVVKVDRFTPEEQKAVEAAVRILGARGLEKSYMLFTKGDALKNMTVEDFIFEDEDSPLPVFITRSFAGKYHVFNNEDGGQEQVQQLLAKSGHLQTSISRDIVRPNDRRIVLLGRPGVGKSASGNTILGSGKFQTNCDFGPVSTNCVAESELVEGRQITVVDTPGFSDEVLSPKALYEEIMKTIVESIPGPHAFVIVVRLGRISGNDAMLFDLLSRLFDKDALKYSMVLFTYGDELGDQSLDQKIQANSLVSDLVAKCGGRYCVFDNKGGRRRQQVRNLLDKIDEMITANGGEHYTSEMIRVAQTFSNEEENLPAQSPEMFRMEQTFSNEEENLPAQSLGTKVKRVWARFCRFVRELWNEICEFFTSLLQKFRSIISEYSKLAVQTVVTIRDSLLFFQCDSANQS